MSLHAHDIIVPEAGVVMAALHRHDGDNDEPGHTHDMHVLCEYSGEAGQSVARTVEEAGIAAGGQQLAQEAESFLMQ